MNIQVAKRAEKRNPENEEYCIPYESERDPRCERDDIEERCEGTQCADDFSVDPFPIRILVLLICLVEIDAIETADGDGEDELAKAEDRVQNVRDAKFEVATETHFALLCLLAWREGKVR